MSARVKVAFIGCGGIVAAHLNQGLKNFEDVEFVGWCDPNRSAAAARAEQVKGQGRIYSDARTMLDEAKPDAVFIMLPPFAHGPAEKLVIERRIPFFIEKPVAVDLPTARKVAEGVRKRRLLTAVGYQNRYRKSIQRVRELLKGQKLVMMHGGWTGGTPNPSGPVFKWWVQKQLSGGQVAEQSTHTVDLMRYIGGEITSVYAVPIRSRLKRPKFFSIEDASMIQFSFANGAAANLYTSCSTAIGDVTLVVWGTGFKAEFAGWEHGVTIRLPDNERITIPGEENIFAVEDRAFIDSVKAGKNKGILAAYDDGLKATAIACAADKSMATGKPVKLDL